MLLASIALDIPTQSIDSAYTYDATHVADRILVGCAVKVGFGSRKAVGFVMSLTQTDDPRGAGVNPDKLKPVEEVVSQPYFNELGARCAQFLADRYIAPLSVCVRLFTPPGGIPKMVKAEQGYWRLEQPTVGQVDDRWVVRNPSADTFEVRKGAVKQQMILQALLQGDLRVSELRTEFGAVAPTLKTLEKHGVITIEHRRRMRPGVVGQFEDEGVFTATVPPQLTEGQLAAVAAINDACDRKNGSVVVVDGVTGSGKTEVYLQVIARILEQGKRAIVLVPEISLTPQTVGRFRGRFGQSVAVMHSRMSQGERYDQWDFIRSGRALVVVGARSALFTPVENLGLIIIDEEHESSYKQDSAPHYVARDVAAWMVQQTDAALVLGSATPSVESLHKVETDALWTKVDLPVRANGRELPQVQVVDMAREFGGGSRSMFSKALQTQLESCLRAGNKAVLLLNQRGFAKFLLCRECGYVPECPSCSLSLTYHDVGNRLVCHHCGYTQPAPVTCPECGSPYLKKFGAGTQRVEADLTALIDSFEGVEAPIIRMDADTTAKKGAHQQLLEQFASQDAAVLLGTQMIAKGLDFDDVTLVGVINADTQLRLPDFRSAERTFDLIEQVAGRAGRAQKAGTVLIQTYSADAIAIQAAAHYDRASFLEDDLPKRRLLKYPPYVRMVDIVVSGTQEAVVRSEATRLSQEITNHLGLLAADWVILPATPCVLGRLKGRFRYHITIKAPEHADLSAHLAPYFRKAKPSDQVRVAIDIDPSSLL